MSERQPGQIPDDPDLDQIAPMSSRPSHKLDGVSEEGHGVGRRKPYRSIFANVEILPQCLALTPLDAAAAVRLEAASKEVLGIMCNRWPGLTP